ncbi:hypothetical protein Tel_17050 (plasmid) [Candidatus Tenderia electrophaga]|jgi:hypothetical protein|uniref:Uncharacterized protein n=1 Tax=Candidatus Tenderia electrophaga TaxID=1748243 RepID=A0A0S2TIH6_9GAMM|nr:hypothetical protein Tel_17050 [Candidatus Tenderia electrophaga]
MRLRRSGVLTLALLLVASPAKASIFGEENVSLAKMVTQLEAMYTKMVDMVQEAKAQNETLSKVNDAIKTVKEEKDAVENTFLHNLDDVFRRDLGNVTELDALSGMTLEEKLLTLSRELDRRLEQPLDEAERERIEAQQRLIEQERFLLQLEQASHENLSKAADGVTDKEAAQIAAESAAIYAALAASERSRQLAEQREGVEDSIQHERIIELQADIFGAASRREE